MQPKYPLLPPNHPLNTGELVPQGNTVSYTANVHKSRNLYICDVQESYAQRGSVEVRGVGLTLELACTKAITAAQEAEFLDAEQVYNAVELAAAKYIAAQLPKLPKSLRY